MQTGLHYGKNFLNDYRLILDTPPIVKKKIAAIKVRFDNDYRGSVIAGGTPFIYLATFSQYETQEQQMLDALDKIAIGFMPFKIHLKNFSHIEADEIFVDVAEKEPFQLLKSQLKNAMDTMQNARFNEIPRITIAQRLQPWQFGKSWDKFSKEHITASYIADKMLLLKRMEGFRAWQIQKYMAFQNMLVV
jgi:hypothetical protein